MNMANIYDVIQDANYYDELDTPRYDNYMIRKDNNNNDKMRYEVINQINCSVKNDDHQYLEMSRNEK